jgi:hypothetical protein
MHKDSVTTLRICNSYSDIGAWILSGLSKLVGGFSQYVGTNILSQRCCRGPVTVLVAGFSRLVCHKILFQSCHKGSESVTALIDRFCLNIGTKILSHYYYRGPGTVLGDRFSRHVSEMMSQYWYKKYSFIMLGDGFYPALAVSMYLQHVYVYTYKCFRAGPSL